MSETDMDTGDEYFMLRTESEEDSDTSSEDATQNAGEEAAALAPPGISGLGEIEEDADDDDDDSDAGHADMDDGLEEEDEDSTAGGGNIRRPVSIQEFLAWRLLGRVPERLRVDDSRRRYQSYEDATPQALTRGSLWQEITLATGAAGPARRNAWGHLDSSLDASMDCSLQADRRAPYGRRVREAVLDAVRTDPRVAAYVTYLGPHHPPPSPPQVPPGAPGAPLPRPGIGSPLQAPPCGSSGGEATAVPPSTPASNISSQTPYLELGPGRGYAPAGPVVAASTTTTTAPPDDPQPPSPPPAAAAAATGPSASKKAALGGMPGIRSFFGGSGKGAGTEEGGTTARAGGKGTRAKSGNESGSGAAVQEVAAAAAAPPEPIPAGYLSGCPAVPAPRMLMRREQGEAAGPCGGWSAAQRRHMQCHRAIPRHPRALVDSLDSRAYIGQFSADGQFFVAAFQDRRVRLYDVERGWRLRKDITTRMCRWTITDTSVSPDQRFVLYSSIMPIVHLVEVGSSYDSVSSVANITQVHEALNFDDSTAPTGGDFRLGRSFGIWSVQWSGDGREIVAGTNDQSVVVLDVETRRVVARVEGHDDDVNAVTYADASPNIIVSGSDDSYVKVWDRRIMPASQHSAAGGDGSGGSSGGSRESGLPVGVLVGHTEGLTHLHSRGDGRHVLSNSKDQTAKLWDIRMMRAGGSLRSAPSAARLPRSHVPQFNWDYRWQEYPAAGRVVVHPHDASLTTFRGHTVRHTLIRAYFSPPHSTGQRFVYTGSVEGGVHVYDVVSGQQVEGSPFRLHRKLVRDVSWHPYDPVMATVSWDGTVVRWDAVPPPPGSEGPQVPGHDAFNDYY